MSAAYTRVVNVRMSDRLHRKLQAMRFAIGKGTTVPDVMREAACDYIADVRKGDPELAERFERALKAMP